MKITRKGLRWMRYHVFKEGLTQQQYIESLRETRDLQTVTSVS